jgi:hypothetical protein
MRKAQKKFSFLKFSIPLTFIFYIMLLFNLHYFLLQIFFSKPLTLILIPTWLLPIFFSFKKEVFGFKIKKQTKEKTFFYSTFITFLVFYLVFIYGYSPFILAATPVCQCSQCGFYPTSNCNNACNEFQYCAQTTCSASGCISNSNCYKCDWKTCSQVSPKVYILTPFIVTGGDLTVSVYFECSQWSSSVKNLTLSLKIDNQDWNECFLNNKGLITDFGWNSNCDMTRMMNGNCGSNFQWSCSQGTCYRTYNSWPIWTKSNFNSKSMNVTFTCKLPYLSGGSHSLTVIAKVYESEVILKPSVITFRIEETDGRKILEFLLFPIKALRKLLPF